MLLSGILDDRVGRLQLRHDPFVLLVDFFLMIFDSRELAPYRIDAEASHCQIQLLLSLRELGGRSIIINCLLQVILLIFGDG